MKIEAPAGFMVVEIGKGCVIVLPERVYVAGLKLGKMLRRREALAKRAAREQAGPNRDYDMPRN